MYFYILYVWLYIFTKNINCCHKLINKISFRTPQTMRDDFEMHANVQNTHLVLNNTESSSLQANENLQNNTSIENESNVNIESIESGNEPNDNSTDDLKVKSTSDQPSTSTTTKTNVLNNIRVKNLELLQDKLENTNPILSNENSNTLQINEELQKNVLIENKFNIDTESSMDNMKMVYNPHQPCKSSDEQPSTATAKENILDNVRIKNIEFLQNNDLSTNSPNKSAKKLIVKKINEQPCCCKKIQGHTKPYEEICNHEKQFRCGTKDKLYTCSFCHQRFATSRCKKQHIKETHADWKYLPCDFCSRKFKTAHAKEQHQKKHLKGQCFCIYCGKRFTNMTSKFAHETTHIIEKSFVCAYCKTGKGCNCNETHRYKYGYHENPRTSKKQFLCIFCSQKFKTIHDKLKHEHAHANNKNEIIIIS